MHSCPLALVSKSRLSAIICQVSYFLLIVICRSTIKNVAMSKTLLLKSFHILTKLRKSVRCLSALVLVVSMLVIWISDSMCKRIYARMYVGRTLYPLNNAREYYQKRRMWNDCYTSSMNNDLIHQIYCSRNSLYPVIGGLYVYTFTFTCSIQPTLTIISVIKRQKIDDKTMVYNMLSRKIQQITNSILEK